MDSSAPPLPFTFATDSHLGFYGLGVPGLQIARGLFGRWATGLVLARGLDPGDSAGGPVQVLHRPRWRRLLAGTRLHRLQARPAAAERIEFDRMAARALPGSAVVIAENSTALLTLRRAADLGARRILVQHNHPFGEFLRILEEEREAWGGPPSFITEELLERAGKEPSEADLVVAFSCSVADALARAGVDRERVRTLHFGVDAARFAPSGVPVGPFTVTHVGWLDLRKGYPYLVEGFREARIPGSRLLLHGGSDLRFHHDLVASLKGGADVSVVRGPVEGTFRTASVAVLPSVSDGYGMAALEAMACGLPVVVTSACGVAQDVVEGVNGFVVPPRDPVALRDRLLALRDPELRVRMGAAARETALRHTWESFRASIAAVTAELMPGDPAAR